MTENLGKFDFDNFNFVIYIKKKMNSLQSNKLFKYLINIPKNLNSKKNFVSSASLKRTLSLPLQQNLNFNSALYYQPVLKRNLFQIAIDGPAASGKSTTARLVAHQLNFEYINSGKMKGHL